MGNLRFSNQIPSCVTRRKKRLSKDEAVGFLSDSATRVREAQRRIRFSELVSAARGGTNRFR